MNLTATVTKADDGYHVQVADGTNVSQHVLQVPNGHLAAVGAITAHRTQYAQTAADGATITVTLAAGAA